MAFSVFPVGKVVSVCDDVIEDPISFKASVLNLYEVIRLSPGVSFPYTLDKMCVVGRMAGAIGEGRFRVEVVRADTNRTIRQSVDYAYKFTDRTRSKLVVVRLKPVVFPVPGYYVVELFCDGRFVDDQAIRVLPAREV